MEIILFKIDMRKLINAKHTVLSKIVHGCYLKILTFILAYSIYSFRKLSLLAYNSQLPDK